MHATWVICQELMFDTVLSLKAVVQEIMALKVGSSMRDTKLRAVEHGESMFAV